MLRSLSGCGITRGSGGLHFSGIIKKLMHINNLTIMFFVYG